jgi:hypothetical protein
MFANILTKALPQLKHYYYRHMLELIALSIEGWGKYKSRSFFSILVLIKGEY